MRAILLSGSGGFGAFEFEREVRIGRSRGNDVVLGSSRISATHARIWFDEQVGAFFVEDLGSRNGTVVADRQVTAPERLLPLDVITLGGAIDLVFRVVSSGDGEARETGPRTVDASWEPGGAVPEATELEGPLRPPPLAPGSRSTETTEVAGDTLPESWNPGRPFPESSAESSRPKAQPDS